jgi:membrane-associated phospholipid phosphatase
MTNRLAIIFSTVGHPFLLLPLVFTALAVREVPFQQAWPALAALLVCLAIMSVFLFVRKKKGLISNLDVSVRKERSRSIYLPVLLLIGLTAAGLYWSGQPFVRETLFFGLLMAVCFAINFRIKISQHTVIVTYLGFLVLAANTLAGMAMLAFAPFVGWSRVVLGRHQKSEVLTGALVGILFGVGYILLFD